MYLLAACFVYIIVYIILFVIIYVIISVVYAYTYIHISPFVHPVSQHIYHVSPSLFYEGCPAGYSYLRDRCIRLITFVTSSRKPWTTKQMNGSAQEPTAHNLCPSGDTTVQISANVFHSVQQLLYIWQHMDGNILVSIENDICTIIEVIRFYIGVVKVVDGN